MEFAKITVAALAALVLAGAMAAPSAAQNAKAGWTWGSPAAVATEPWRFQFVGYAWAPEAPAKIDTVDGRAVDANLPESFDTIFDSLEFAVMAESEIHKGPFGVFLAPVFYEGKDSEQFTGALGENRTVTVKETVWLVDYGVSYDLGTLRLGGDSDSPTVTLQPYGGFRYFHDKIKVDLNPGAFDLGLNLRKTIEFNTPIVGVETLWDLSDRWSLRLGGDFGGWDVDNVSQTWQAIGTLAYRFEVWGQTAGVFGGYRYLHLHYDDGSLAIKVDVKGPLVGFGFEF